MTCYSPLQAYYGGKLSSGKRKIVFKESKAESSKALRLSCGRCIGCRLKRSCHWSIRCSHEASLYENNCFITLTFSKEGLIQRAKDYEKANKLLIAKGKDPLPVPNPWTLDHRDYQLFMKRLRKRFGDGIRFYMAGEYGDKNGRPHYHAILFNFDFKDRRFFKTTKAGCKLYRSKDLESLWTYGYSSVGTATFESAGYVARYVMKKMVGKDSRDHYVRVCRRSGEVFELKPEYTRMSRRPGIGASWIDSNYKDVYPKDFLTHNRRCVKTGKPKVLIYSPPRYYDNRFELIDPDMFEDVKIERERKAIKFSAKKDSTFERLRDRERVRQLRFSSNYRVVSSIDDDPLVPSRLSEIFSERPPPVGLYDLESFLDYYG